MSVCGAQNVAHVKVCEPAMREDCLMEIFKERHLVRSAHKLRQTLEQNNVSWVSYYLLTFFKDANSGENCRLWHLILRTLNIQQCY